MDALVIILIIIILVLLFKRTFSSAIYAIVIVDIFLRLVDFIRIHIPQIAHLISGIPASLNAVITRYTGSIIELILLWLMFIVYVIFEFYIFRTFLKKK